MQLSAPIVRPNIEVRVRRFALLLASLTLGLMILGAYVRSIDAGLSCPDWPLCHGQYLPPFEPILTESGPVPTPEQMNAEWFHRLLAGLVSIGVLGLAWLAYRSGNRTAFRWTLAATAMLLAQIVLGAVTVLLGNIHYSVAIHLAAATTFLLLLLQVARATGFGTRLCAQRRATARRLFVLNRVAVLVLGAAALLGAFIATTPGADLVCPAFPHCGRAEYAGVEHLVGLQMTHRVLALAVYVWLLISMFLARRDAAVFRWTGGAAILASVQVALGISNVFFGVPPLVSTAHLGVAVLLFVTLFEFTLRLRRVVASE